MGAIALFEALKLYDPNKDKYNNFDVFAYYYILNRFRNELKRINKYKKIEICIDLYENEYLAPIIEDDLIERLEFGELLEDLNETQKEIINLKRLGYKNEEIAKRLNISLEQLKYQLKISFNKIRAVINKYKIN